VRGGLFALGLACGSLAQVLMHLATGELQGKPAAALGLYAVSFIVLFIWVGRRGDAFFLPIITALCGLGLAEIWRIDPSRGWQQVLWIVLGTVVYGITGRFRRWNALADLKYVWALLATIMLLITLVFGAEVGGARAWLRIGRFSMQTSEIAKLLVVISLAGHLAGSKEFLASPGRRIGFIRVPSARHLGPLLLIWAVSMMMFVGQRDLGGAILLFGVFVLMLYVASGRFIYLTLGVLLAAAGGAAAYVTFNHVRVRFLVWLNPWRYYETIGYQIIQGLFSLAAGGIAGTGLGFGSPYLIPAAANDFIFNALVEELGLIGATFIIAMFMVLVARGLAWATAHGNNVAALAGMGLSVLLGLQAVIIIGGVTRLIPVTGITLPFLSYGGSSLISSFAQLGLIHSLSTTAPTPSHEGYTSEVPAWK
jgi:cell division protein FtsW (lipid II flippase)